MDERVRLLRREPLLVVDAPPRDRDRLDGGRLRGLDVEWRVADVGGGLRRRLEPREREQAAALLNRLAAALEEQMP